MTVDELEKRLAHIDEKIEKMAHDLKRIKQFFMWSFIATLVTFVLPLIIAVIAIPIMMKKYLSAFDGLL